MGGNKADQHTRRTSRRSFIAGSAASIAVLAGNARATGESPAASAPRFRPGVQLYSVRDSMASDVHKTLRAIAGIGYREVEFAGYFGHSPTAVRHMLEDLGLDAPATHMDARRLRDDPMPLVAAAAEIGHRYVIIAWLHPDDRLTVDQYKAWADTCNRLGEICRDHGMRCAYHNHDFEFTPIDGTVPYDILLDETDPALVDFELDLFWVRKSGREILPTLASAPGRFTLAHIKDMDANGEIVDPGEGLIDFASILASPVAGHFEHLFVENDRPADPFRSVAAGHYAISRLPGYARPACRD
jgi:sugar phosphate isomerase/epimerase